MFSFDSRQQADLIPGDQKGQDEASALERRVKTPVTIQKTTSSGEDGDSFKLEPDKTRRGAACFMRLQLQ